MSRKILKNEKKLKKERKRYYASLAEDVGERLKTLPKQESFADSPCSNEQEVPTWFSSAMEKVIFLILLSA